MERQERIDAAWAHYNACARNVAKAKGCGSADVRTGVGYENAYAAAYDQLAKLGQVQRNRARYRKVKHSG